MTPDVSRRLPPDADIEETDAPGQAAVRQSSLNRLATLLRIADGAWAMAVYRSTAIRSQMIDELTARLAPLPVVNLSLVDRPARLFEYLRDLPPDAPPVALMCYAYGDGLPALLRSLDLQRDALARLPHRLVFWVNSYERSQFLELAPNFASRLSGTFQFPGESLAGAPPLAPAALPRTGGGESGASTARRRPLLPVRSARHRDEQIDYLQRRIRDLQQLPRRDDEAIGDAWYDLAGLLESGEPRRLAEAEAAYAEAARAYAAAGEALAEAEARYRAGEAAWRAYLPQAALDHLHRALHLYRILTDTPQTTRTAVLGEANVLKAQGDVLYFLKQTEEALARYDQALGLFRTVGDRLGEANVLSALARDALGKDRDRAIQLLGQAKSLRQEIGDIYSLAVDLGNFGAALLQNGFAEDAVLYLSEAKQLFESRNLGKEAEFVTAQIQMAPTTGKMFQSLGSNQTGIDWLNAAGEIAETMGGVDLAAILRMLPPSVRAAIESGDLASMVENIARFLPPQIAAQFQKMLDPTNMREQILRQIQADRLAEDRNALVEHLRDLCEICLQSEDAETLYEAAEELIRLEAATAEIYFYWGDAAFELGRTDIGHEGYLRAIELAPDDVMTRRNYANQLIRLHQLEAAEAQLDAAAAIDPESPFLALRRAELARAGDDRLAAQHWAAEALQRQPGWDEAQAILDWAVAPATEEGR